MRLLGVLLLPLLAAGCTKPSPRGKVLISQYGCGTCHQIQSVGTAVGRVGPPLTGIGSRSYLAGRLPNTYENMVRWIQHPKQVDPETVMPEMNVTEQDAREIAGFLYTLR